MKALILDAQHTVFEGVISMAVLPGNGGELSIMDDHEPIFVALAQGQIDLYPVVKGLTFVSGPSEKTETQGRTEQFFINQGVARMKNNELVVLIE